MRIPSPMRLIVFLLLGAAVRAQDDDEDDASMHFSDSANGRVAWVVHPAALPWIGSYDYLGSSLTANTVLMSVVDSNTGKTLAECTTSEHHTGDEEWERFVWTLTSDALQCNVSETNSSRTRFPLSTAPRSYSIRIQASRGPRCLRDLVVQNERPSDCPPRLERNAFAAHALECGCPAEGTAVNSNAKPAFPLFQLRPTAPPVPSFRNLQTTATNAWTVSPCANFICENNGTCVVGADGLAKCLCQLGFVGEHCEADVCKQLNCLNGGSCQVSARGAECVCPPFASGPRCETLAPMCQPKCENGGECLHQDNPTGAPISYCECTEGFVGPNCNAIDVCHDESLCAVFGPKAHCEVDGVSRGTISPHLVNATYDCLCPDPKSHEMVECMSLVLASSTIVPAPPATAPVEPLFPAVHISTAAAPHTPSAPTAPPAFPVTDFTAPPTIHTHPPTTSTSEEPPSVAPSSSVPVTHVTPPVTHPTHQTFPPTPFIPHSSQTTFVPTEPEPEPETTKKPTQTPFTVLPPFHVLPSFSTTPPPESEEEETTTELATTSQTEETTTIEEELSEEETETTEGVTFPLSTPPPSIVPPIVTETPRMPIVPTWSTQAPLPEEESGEPISHEEETTEEPATEATTIHLLPVVTEQPRLPFWMVSTTNGPHEEEEEEEEEGHEDEEGHGEVGTEIAPPTEGTESTETTQPVTSPPTTSPTTQAPARPGDTGERSGSSSASWIIAIISIALLAILIGIIAVFVLRYVRRSRKLHGKYNPAREEHALSSAYSMPMTSVTKEERLI